MLCVLIYLRWLSSRIPAPHFESNLITSSVSIARNTWQQYLSFNFGRVARKSSRRDQRSQGFQELLRFETVCADYEVHGI